MSWQLMIEEIPSELDDEDDIDPFAELNIAEEAPARKGENILDSLIDDEDYGDKDTALAAFMEDDPIDSSEEDVIVSFDEEDAPVPTESTVKRDKASDAERTYSLLLETVWVDDILDPSEVELLARKRKELGISFTRHLEMVRRIIEA
ncbi:MAG: hypothetical protein ACKVJ7_01480 [Candidatus Poseidoniales archaeon]|jgi:hypothetical protein|tara:strand:- start:118 stop:561 length:444 start_codon:yes stop_codon:yes gene_type:complete